MPTSKRLNLIEALGEAVIGDDFDGGNDERYRVRGGNQQIADRIAAKLGEQHLHPGHRLVRIDKQGTAFKCTFVSEATNVEVEADYVVLAMPFTTLRDVELKVSMPPAKSRAIAELGMGRCAKLHIGMTERPWVGQGLSGDLMTDLGPGVGWDSARGTKAPGGVYTVFMAGSRADRVGSMSIPEMASVSARDLDRCLLGFAQAMNGTFNRVNWTSQRWAKGSYACFRPGQRTDFGAAVATPVGRIFFAGEHCSAENMTYMEGAVESGLRVAREIAQQTVGIPRPRTVKRRRR
jgi:monoamine oxidase